MNPEALVQIAAALQAIVAAPVAATIFWELFSLVTQFTTADERESFAKEALAWLQSFPQRVQVANTDEAEQAQRQITNALNEIASNIRRGPGTGGIGP